MTTFRRALFRASRGRAAPRPRAPSAHCGPERGPRPTAPPVATRTQAAAKMNPANVARYVLFLLWMKTVNKGNVVCLDEMAINLADAQRIYGR